MKSLLRPALYPFTLLTLLAGCAEQEVETIHKTEDRLSAELLRGLTLDTVRLTAATRPVALTGRVALNADQTAPVYALTGGVVRQVPVSLGDQVRQGQVLAVIHSTQAADREQQQTSADLELAAARQQLATAESLHADGLLAEQDLAQARNNLQRARQEVGRQRKQAAVFGRSTTDATYTLRAPIAGFITEQHVAAGTQFTTGSLDHLFTISNLDRIWVLADVFQNDITKVKIGQAVEVTTLAYPATPFTGTIDKVYNLLHADSKTMKVRVQLPNLSYRLKPGMHARVLVHSTTTTQPQLTVPSSSVVFANDRRYVLVLKDARMLESREVQLLHTNGKESYVQAGVAPGEQVVSRNALLLYKELND